MHIEKDGGKVGNGSNGRKLHVAWGTTKAYVLHFSS